MNPFLILACGMAIVIGGILWLRWHPFLALILGAFGVALLTPMESLRDSADRRVAKGEWSRAAAEKWVRKPAPARVADEFGRTCGNLGMLIAMATIIGEAMQLSGAATAIATRMLRCVAVARAHWAFFAASFLLCIPVMLDTVMYLLAPLFQAVARKTDCQLCLCGEPTCRSIDLDLAPLVTTGGVPPKSHALPTKSDSLRRRCYR